MTRDADGNPDFEPVDDNGLTVEQAHGWRIVYAAIADLVQTAVAGSPTPAEAHRRIGLLMLELRVHASAIDTLSPTWTAPPANEHTHKG